MKNKNNAAVALGKLGGLKTKERYGVGYFKKMAEDRDAKRKELMRSVWVEELDDPATLKRVQKDLEKIDSGE